MIIAQKANGKSIKWFQLDATAGDVADLQALLEGEVTLFNEESRNGTAGSVTPTDFNRKKFSVGKHGAGLSCSVTVPHVKLTAKINNIEAVVIGAFDATFEVATACDYMNYLYDRNSK
ncbi:MAG: hypothetical protein NTZ60_02195 [Campylobacterales bacterium]|nr:hypothetical protein [Campylobacterales bacterium]